jgi:hypothetical protein
MAFLPYSLSEDFTTIDSTNVVILNRTGHGATFTTQSLTIYPIGTVIPVYVNDGLAFPPLSYVLITDGIYSITGQVTTRTTPSLVVSSPVLAQPIIPATNPNVISVRITTINNGIVGLAISQGAGVTFSGAPGPAGTTSIGDYGTVIFNDFPFNPPIAFVSDLLPLVPTVLATQTFRLPNNRPIQYRVVAEFTGNVVTNEYLSSNPASSNIVYLGITSSAAVGASNLASTFAGYAESPYGPMAGPVILLPMIVADGACTVSSPDNFANNNQLSVKFAGTFNSGVELDFSVVAAAMLPTTTFWVSGDLVVTCYPMYQ